VLLLGFIILSLIFIISVCWIDYKLLNNIVSSAAVLRMIAFNEPGRTEEAAVMTYFTVLFQYLTVQTK